MDEPFQVHGHGFRGKLLDYRWKVHFVPKPLETFQWPDPRVCMLPIMFNLLFAAKSPFFWLSFLLAHNLYLLWCPPLFGPLAHHFFCFTPSSPLGWASRLAWVKAVVVVDAEDHRLRRGLAIRPPGRWTRWTMDDGIHREEREKYLYTHEHIYIYV